MALIPALRSGPTVVSRQIRSRIERIDEPSSNATAARSRARHLKRKLKKSQPKGSLRPSRRPHIDHSCCLMDVDVPLSIWTPFWIFEDDVTHSEETEYEDDDLCIPSVPEVEYVESLAAMLARCVGFHDMPYPSSVALREALLISGESDESDDDEVPIRYDPPAEFFSTAYEDPPLIREMQSLSIGG